MNKLIWNLNLAGKENLSEPPLGRNSRRKRRSPTSKRQKDYSFDKGVLSFLSSTSIKRKLTDRQAEARFDAFFEGGAAAAEAARVGGADFISLLTIRKQEKRERIKSISSDGFPSTFGHCGCFTSAHSSIASRRCV